MNIHNLPNESIKLLSNCPVCQKPYGKNNAKLVDQVDDANLLHVSCANCRSSVLVTIFASGFGITSIGLLTDLTMDDVKKMRQWEVIDKDDVLDIYQYLQQEKIFNI